MVDAAVQAYGRVDLMINNAGIMPRAPLERLTIDDWNRTIDINIKGVLTTVVSPGAVATELPNSVTEPDIADGIHKYFEEFAIHAESFAQAVAFAMSQPDKVDANEILFRPTRQVL